jgi:hypothetical protein
MKIEIDTQVIRDAKISPTEYVILYMIAGGNNEELSWLSRVFNHRSANFMRSALTGLESAGLITVPGGIDEKVSGKDILITEKGGKAIGRVVKEDYFEEWIELWPKGVQGAGGYLKNGSAGTRRKFKTFLTRTNYDKDTVIGATRNYLQEQERNNYFKYCKRSDYFVEKDGVSSLEAACENYTGESEGKQINDYHNRRV